MIGYRVKAPLALVTMLMLSALSANAAVMTSALAIGSSGEDVVILQTILARDPSIYPEGLITGYFGPLTRDAVRRFQAREGIVRGGDETSTGYGRVGALTDAALAKAYPISTQFDPDIDWLIGGLRNLRADISVTPSTRESHELNERIEDLKAYVEKAQAGLVQMVEIQSAASTSQSSGGAKPPSAGLESSGAKRQLGCSHNGLWYPEGTLRPAFWGLPTGTAYIPALRCVNSVWVRDGNYR